MTDPTADTVRRARRAFLWVGVLVPVAVLLAAGAVIAAWLPELPDPAATHWSGGGGPDGFGPAWTYLAVGVGLPLVLVGAFALLAWNAHRLPSQMGGGTGWSPTARFLGAANLALAGVFATTMLPTVDVQRGLADAHDTPDITIWVVAGFGVMVLLGVAGWFLQPAVPVTPVRGVDAASLPAAPAASVWTERVMIGGGGAAALGTAAVVVVPAVAFTFAAVPTGPAGWIVLLTALIVLAAVALVIGFDVRVDAAGLRVASIVGWPRTRVRAADVEKVEVVAVNPLGDFGGWGWRWGMDGRIGWVLRAGEALQVTRRRGRTLVVTVDDAAGAAAALEAARVGGGAASGTRTQE